MLFALGSNGAGQLGVGDKIDRAEPTECITEGDVVAHINSIRAGGNHVLMTTADGDTYVAGSDEYGQIGPYAGVPNIQCLVEMRLPEHIKGNIKFCSATWEATIFVTTNDRIFTFGQGNKGELGRGQQVHISKDVQRPLSAPELRASGATIIDLASCVSHAVIVMSDGTVYGWGNGRKGQLGQPQAIVWEPRKIENVKFRVVRAVCGREFTYLVGHPNEGRHLILGSDKWAIRSNAPKSVPDWRLIDASWGSIFCLQDSGSIISWGRNDHGQLAPINLPRLTFIAAGSEHILAVTAENHVIAWGWGEHGNCGSKLDDDGDVKGRSNILPLPETATAKLVSGISAGCATSWIWIS
ncbi:hypothetical protein MMC09_004424 [Bachmanniomyces sp. S44760]|nr:hypothetical protein [Bachmanniomyces sp. S44760]